MDLIKNLKLDTSEGVARFGVEIGYDRDDVVRSVVKRCGVDGIEAERIVDKALSEELLR